MLHFIPGFPEIIHRFPYDSNQGSSLSWEYVGAHLRMKTLGLESFRGQTATHSVIPSDGALVAVGFFD